MCEKDKRNHEPKMLELLNNSNFKNKAGHWQAIGKRKFQGRNL